MTGKEKVVILCSPHNPGGRVWSMEELKQVADFCKTPQSHFDIRRNTPRYSLPWNQPYPHGDH